MINNNLERFNNLFYIDIVSGCHLWTGAVFSKGNARFWIGNRRAGTFRDLIAYRYIWELEHGDIPDNMCILHKCKNNLLCVNINHLYVSDRCGWRGTIEQRFNSFVYIESTTGCHLWSGCCDSSGYGNFSLGQRKSGEIGAHIFAWRMTHGPVPDNSFVLHKCDVRNCVNPDHLYLGTNDDNMKDMARKNRSKKSKRGMPRGVTQTKGGKFEANVCINSKKIYLGTYDTIFMASRIAAAERLKHLGTTPQWELSK